MCGRFTLRTPLTVLSQQFMFELGPVASEAPWRPRYNIAPTQSVMGVLRRDLQGPRELAELHWGLIPSWAKDPKGATGMINARAETVAEKPAFRSAFASRRCLILADGFFEWKAVGKQKLPYYYRLKSEQPLAFAGLWERWRPPDSAGPALESCTIITTAANDLCRELHDRMPVILEPADYDRWLDPTLKDKEQLLEMLQPFPAEEMKVELVNPRVNNVRYDDEACLVAEPQLF